MKVEQKWGFGMAPVKPGVQAERRQSAVKLTDVLKSGLTDDETLAVLSEIKGLFTRCWKQDQWDWFTVWMQLGRPGTNNTREISYTLKRLRDAIRDSEIEGQQVAIAELGDLGIRPRLETFLSDRPSVGPTEVGCIYVLSTRENRDVLKIGYTNRSVEERVREINANTGVVIPFGVRAMWVVRDARGVEASVHDLLAEYRIRKDREFFKMDFRIAFQIIRDHIYAERIER